MFQAFKTGWLAMFLACVLSVNFLGCDENSEQESSRYQQLITDINEIEYQIRQEMILKASSDRDKSSIRDLLRDISNGLDLLGKRPTDPIGYTLIKRAITTLRYDFIQLLERDRAILDSLIREVLQQTYASSKQYGMAFDVDWAIYSFRFSRPIDEEGFVSWPQSAWKEDWALDRSYVATKGQDSDAWLIAPALDLTGVDHPKFRIVHTININANDREKSFDRQAFLRKSFGAKVSLDYKGGDPSPDKCECTWHDVSLGELPSSKDFHTAESPEIDLSRFRGKNVTIALYYDTRGLGRHYVNWNVSLFEVSGAGSYEQSQGRVVKTLISYSFGKKELDPFQVLTQTPNSLQWESGGRRQGSYEWAVVKNRKENKAPFQRTSSLLLSPRFELVGAKDPVFSMVEVINYIGRLELNELKILISADYDGGNILDAQWIPIERDADLQIPEKSWDDLNISGVSLANLPGSKFTLLFWFDSKTESNVIWELKSFSLEARGGRLRAEEFSEQPFIPLLEEAGGGNDSGGLIAK